MAGSKPSPQIQEKLPSLLKHSPPLHIREFSVHSSTSIQLRPSAIKIKPGLQKIWRNYYHSNEARKGYYSTTLTYTHTNTSLEY